MYDADTEQAARELATVVRRWDIITIGNLSRNRYWGESDERPLRPALCTCTLIVGDGYRLLVDPSHADAGRMAAELDRRTGLAAQDVDHVFVTHEHGDHHAGLRHFPHARWLAAPEVANVLNASGQYERDLEAVAGVFLPGVEAVPTPGHTLSHHSLRFACDGRVVVIAGDAVMTREFSTHRQGFFNSVDLPLAAQTIERLTEMADIIVPGHDNCFLITDK